MYQRRLLCRVALVIPAQVILPQITETSVMPGGIAGLVQGCVPSIWSKVSCGKRWLRKELSERALLGRRGSCERLDAGTKIRSQFRGIAGMVALTQKGFAAVVRLVP